MTHNAENDAGRECDWCGKSATIVYTDVLGCGWCEGCFQNTYLENFPEPTRVTPPAEVEHDEWCAANGCRCGKCPCLGPPSCVLPPGEQS